MSKLAELYAKHKHPKGKNFKGMYFKYADLGNCYSFVEFSYKVDKKEYSQQMKVEEFFEFIGEAIIKIMDK